jgi:hypothetical protein
MDGYQSIHPEFQRASRWHPRQVAHIRVGVGIWLLFLTAGLYSSGHGGDWEWLLVLLAAVHFYVAFRLCRAVGKDDRHHADHRRTSRGAR